MKLKQKINPDGSWVRYDYGSDFDKTITPVNNSLVSDSENLCRVVSITYTSTIPQITTVETVLGQVVSKKYRKIENDGTTYTDIECPDPNATYSDSNNLVTVTTVNHAGQTISLKRRDGTMSFYSYSKTSTNKTTTVSSGQPNTGATVIQEGAQTVTVVGTSGEMLTNIVYLITGGNVDTNKVLGQEIYTYDSSDYYKLTPTIQFLDGTTSSGTSCNCGSSGPTSTTDKDGTVTYYTYDSMNRQIATQTLGITTTNVLDAAGRTLASIRIGTNGSWNTLSQSAYDVSGRVSKMTNALNGVTTFSEGLDANGYFVKTNIYPDGGTRIESYFKDGTLGKLVGTAVHPVRYTNSVELESSTNRFFTQEIKLDASGNDTSEWTKTYYDAIKRPYKTVYSNSTTNYSFSQSFYNAQGQLSKQVDADGVSTLYQYNPKGELAYTALDTNRDGTINFAGNDRITWTTNYVTTNNGTTIRRTQNYVWPTAGTDASNLVSTVETSADGLRSWNILWNAGTGVTNRSQTVYAGSGSRYVTNTAPDSSYTLSAYSYGRLLSTTRYDSLNYQLSAINYSYDAHGRVLTTMDARNGATSFAYNTADQVATLTTPAPGTGQGPQTTRTYFDSMSRATNVVLADLTSITNEFSVAGELRRTFGSRTYPVGYGYDAQGRMTKMTNWSGFAASTGTRVTTWNYDGFRGFLTNKVYDGGSTGPSYAYTPGGRLLTRAWARGITTTNSYNNNGDLLSTSYSDTTPSVAMVYDRRGRASTVTNGSAVCSYAYNDANQLLSETNSAGTLAGFWVTNAYDGYLRRGSVSALTSNTTRPVGGDTAPLVIGEALNDEINTLLAARKWHSLTSNKTYESLW